MKNQWAMFRFRPVLCWAVSLGVVIASSAWLQAQSNPPPGSIQLLVRADDMGTSHAANEACVKACREGIARSVEVVVPGAWFMEAVKLLKEYPGLDAGVHLTLTSEWDLCKWRPLTPAPSLVDDNGYFRPMTSQRKDFPPHTGFLEANSKLEEVEAELRAQITMAKRLIPQVSHLSAHMGTATCTPPLRALVERLAKEYQLRLESGGLQGVRGFGGSQKSADEKIESLVGILETLAPGCWLLVEHPAFDTPEMRAIGHLGYDTVAVDREGVTRSFTSEKVKAVIQKRGIRLISYADLNTQ